jgi:nuclear GTP-binding protein
MLDGSKKAYFKELRKIIDNADVVLEVLDARCSIIAFSLVTHLSNNRDPLGCRCKSVEAAILKKDANKKIILVLNKIDLVPKANVEAWLKYLRNEYPSNSF